MKRTDIIKIAKKDISDKGFKISNDNLKLVIKSYEQAIIKSLENKENEVILSGFLSFKRRKTAKRKFKNFITNKIEMSNGRDIVKIYPGSEIKKVM